MIDVDASTVRTLLHLLGVSVWVGGQVVMAALVPVLRGLGPNAPRAAARRFGQVAWPFFALTVVTGFWHVWSIDLASRGTTYQAVFGLKLLLVAGTGMAAFVHAAASARLVKAITGAGALIMALGALFCGVLMVT